MGVDAEIVLVLDYSGSMNSKGKWQAMRNAALDLVNKVGNGGVNENIRFGLVPFSGHVRLSLPQEMVVAEAKSPKGKDAFSITKGIWTGCTQDRLAPYNTSDSTPDSTEQASLFGLIKTGNGNCQGMANNNLTAMPLTSDHATVSARLSAMRPFNMTHISLGMEIGYHLVSPNAPFTEGRPYDDEGTKKFVVLLTDGQQTTEAWGHDGSHDVPNGEDNLKALCNAMKNDGITITTVAFDLKNQPTKDRLQYCASGPDHYFDATDNGELAAAFENIGKLVKGQISITR